MTLLEISPDVKLFARLLLLIFFLIWTRKKIAQSLKGKFGNADIMDEMISLENILALIAYLVLLGLFWYLWPIGWNVWKESDIFWPAQGLIILAVIGRFSVRKLYLSWFFFIFFLLVAIVLTVASLIRDPRIIPPKITREEMPYVPEPQTVATTATVTAEMPVENDNPPVIYEPDVKEQLAAAQQNDGNTFFIDAPFGRDGEVLYQEIGWIYNYYPEDTVEGFPDTGEPFIFYPGKKASINFRSIYWNSHCGHDTKIKVIRVRKNRSW